MKIAKIVLPNARTNLNFLRNLHLLPYSPSRSSTLLVSSNLISIKGNIPGDNHQTIKACMVSKEEGGEKQTKRNNGSGRSSSSR